MKNKNAIKVDVNQIIAHRDNQNRHIFSHKKERISREKIRHFSYDVKKIFSFKNIFF